METYGKEMGYSMTQVALRAGHNPAVAARYYSGKVAETDRELARAVASLLVDRVPAGGPSAPEQGDVPSVTDAPRSARRAEAARARGARGRPIG